MIIRREQMRAFEAYMRQSFEDRMVAHMRDDYPVEYARHTGDSERDEGAHELVRLAVERAGRVGATTEGAIQQYLEIMLDSSPDFESEEAMRWAREILADGTLAGATRIQLIHRKVSGTKPAAQPATKKE